MPMTGRTADAFIHVDAVIEIDIIRQVVNANPFEWLTSAKAGADRFEIRTVGPYLLVAIHAGVC